MNKALECLLSSALWSFVGRPTFEEPIRPQPWHSDEWSTREIYCSPAESPEDFMLYLLPKTVRKVPNLEVLLSYFFISITNRTPSASWMAWLRECVTFGSNEEDEEGSNAFATSSLCLKSATHRDALSAHLPVKWALPKFLACRNTSNFLQSIEKRGLPCSRDIKIRK